MADFELTTYEDIHSAIKNGLEARIRSVNFQ